MIPVGIPIGFAFAVMLFISMLACVAARRRNMHLWLRSYCRFVFSTYGSHEIQRCNSQVLNSHCPRVDEDSCRENGDPLAGNRYGDNVADDDCLDVFIAICDHFEPEWNHPTNDIAVARVQRWLEEYPALFSRYHDVEGRPPQHTFFFPQDQYAPRYLDRLAQLCNDGYGDVDVHLHHDADTSEQLGAKLDGFRETLWERHSLLRRDPATGEIVYGFIHGNWALCNSRPDGRWCGVNDEIDVLRATGCYADFTMPSAPSDTQTKTINSIYYAFNQPGRPKSHDIGVPARVGTAPPHDGLLLIQGPLMLDWRSRRLGLLPRIENGDLHASHPPTGRRLDLWLKAGVHVVGRKRQCFVKLHTHGAKDGNIDMLLGPRMQRFHEELALRAQADRRFRYHYVTAWEMAQLVHAAETGANPHTPETTTHVLA